MPARRCSMRTEEGWRGSPIRSHLRCTEVHAQNARSRPSRDPPSRRPAKAVQIMNVMFSASRPAAGLRSMPRQPRGSTDSSARARPLRGREEHQDRQILQDIVEPVFGAGGDEHDAPWTDLATLSSHPNSRAAANEVIDLILRLHRLLVLDAPAEFVLAATHRYDPQQLDGGVPSTP